MKDMGEQRRWEGKECGQYTKRTGGPEALHISHKAKHRVSPNMAFEKKSKKKKKKAQVVCEKYGVEMGRFAHPVEKSVR